MGYVIDADGLHTDPDRVQSIKEYPAPMNLKQLCRFIGMVSWFSRFLPNFSKDKVPLCHLLKKDVRWHWNAEQQEAFEKLKAGLSDAKTLDQIFLRDFTCVRTHQIMLLAVH